MAHHGFRLILALAVLTWGSAASAQTKIDPNVELKLRDQPLARVIILTRPDPDQPGGGASVSAPASYVGGRLGASGHNVRPLGQLPAASGEIDRNGLAILRADPNVALVSEDVPVPPMLMESVAVIGADKLHSADIKGSKYAVAVLDTGIESSHAAFNGSIVAEACFSTENSRVYRVRSLCPNGLDVSLLEGAAGGCPVGIKGCDHGTHVAGIVAGHDMSFDGHDFGGIAPAARLVPIQVFTLFDDDRACIASRPCVLSFTSDQLRALDWVYKKRDEYKIAAVNMSLGGGYYDKYCDATSALTDIIERLKSKGVLTVVAAGNGHFFDGVSEPACVSAAISVAALRKNGTLDVTYSNVSPFVDIAAPGTEIVSSVLNNGYARASGTSMAAPHIAGAVALLRDQYPDLTALEIETLLKSSGVSVTDPRTGTVLVRAMLAAPGQPTDTAATDVTPSKETAGAGVWETGSFIVKTDKSEQELKATLDEKCPELDCSLKAISEDQYVIELAPKTSLSPGERAGLNYSADSLQEMLGKNVTVYYNRAFAPF